MKSDKILFRFKGTVMQTEKTLMNDHFKGTVMQTEKTLMNDRLRISKVS